MLFANCVPQVGDTVVKRGLVGVSLAVWNFHYKRNVAVYGMAMVYK